MRFGRHALPWLALVAALAGNMPCGPVLAAGPRDPPGYYVTPPRETAEQRRARRVVEMDAALRRLAGRFRVEPQWVLAKPAPANSPRTVVDCAVIGEGPGLYCVHYVARPQPAPRGQAAAGRAHEVPGRLLRSEVMSVARIVEYGIDPNASRIRVMIVTQGDATRMAGTMRGDTLTMWGRCWNSNPPLTCAQRAAFIADSEDMWITYYVNWNRGAHFALRRLAEDDTDPASWPATGLPPTFPKPRPGPR